MAVGNTLDKRKAPSALQGRQARMRFAVPPCFAGPYGSQPPGTPTRPDSVTGVPGADYFAHPGSSPARLTRELPTSPPPARTSRRLSARGSHRTVLVHCHLLI